MREREADKNSRGNQLEREMCHRRQNSAIKRGKEGKIKIVYQIYSNNFPRATSNVGIAGEIAINLEDEGNGCEDKRSPLTVSDWHRPCQQASPGVRHDHLFEEPPQHDPKSGADVAFGKTIQRVKLRSKVIAVVQ